MASVMFFLMDLRCIGMVCEGRAYTRSLGSVVGEAMMQGQRLEQSMEMERSNLSPCGGLPRPWPWFSLCRQDSYSRMDPQGNQISIRIDCG